MQRTYFGQPQASLLQPIHDLLATVLTIDHILQAIVDAVQSTLPELDAVGLDLARAHQFGNLLQELRHMRAILRACGIDRAAKIELATQRGVDKRS